MTRLAIVKPAVEEPVTRGSTRNPDQPGASLPFQQTAKEPGDVVIGPAATPWWRKGVA